MIEVTLDAALLAYADAIARARVRFNRAARLAPWMLARGVTEQHLHFVGACGEVAVAHVERRRIRCAAVSMPEFGWKASGPDVGRWQVKTTTVTPPRLAVAVHHASRVRGQRLLLVHAALPVCTIVGWIDAAELLQDCNIRPLSRCDSYIAPRLHDYTGRQDESQSLRRSTVGPAVGLGR